MTPRELWSNEAQERYVLAIAPARLAEFRALCERERCPFAVVGIATDDDRLEVRDPLFGTTPVDMELETLFGKPPRMTRDVARVRPQPRPFHAHGIALGEAVRRVLLHPSVGDKTFLVTIGDRTVGGLCARDPMVGPFQVPVADCATTLMSFEGYAGEAFAIGERGPLAVIDAPASGRMAVGEALTNLAAAPVAALSRVKLSANWMAAAGAPGEDAALHDTVRAVALELCPRLGVGIPVGKDSLSMRTTWRDGERSLEVRAPLSLVVSAFAPVRRPAPDLDARAACSTREGRSCCCWTSPPAARGWAGRSWRRCSARPATRRPTSTTPELVKSFYAALAELRAEELVLAYHDRSDGGLFVTLAEMAFAARCGLDVDLLELAGPRAAAPRVLATLFAEELGAVLQVRAAQSDARRRDPGQARAARAAARGAERRRRDAPALRERRPARGAARGAAAALVRDELAHADPARPPRVGAAGVRPDPGRRGARPGARASRSTWPRTSPPRSSPRGSARRSRCCASRASTATSRWPRPSTAPASTPWTCT